MKLKELIQLQQAGAFNVEVRDDYIILGGLKTSKEQCEYIAKKIGWLEFSQPAHEMIGMTKSFVKVLKSVIKDENILNNTELTFQNFRQSGTMSYYNRIKFVNDGVLNITVLNGIKGMGCKYAVYTPDNMYNVPKYKCHSIRELGKLINKIVNGEEEEDFENERIG